MKITREQCVVGTKLWYTSFGTKDFAIIEVVGKPTKMNKRGIFTFDAKIIDASNWSVGGRYDWSTEGAIKGFNNCFVGTSFEKMCELVEDNKAGMIRLITKMAKKEGIKI